MSEKIKDFWSNQAREFGRSFEATIPDKFLKELEIKAVLKYLPERGTVADIGCGNGYSDFLYAKAKKDLMFECFDYSEEMIKIARRELELKGLTNLQFVTLDINNMKAIDKYECVITDRCLINLQGEREQRDAILKIVGSLKRDGKYIMCEDTIQGLEKLNRLRKRVGLDEINIRWHNKYIDESLLFKLERDQSLKIDKIDNFSTFYYVASRVINGRIAENNNEEPAYDSEINKIAKEVSLMDDFGDCTPLKIFLISRFVQD